MKASKLFVVCGIVVVVMLSLALTVGLTLAQGSGPANEPAIPEAPGDTVGNYIPVQGRLTDASGNPINATLTITFRLYDVPSGGAELCHDTNSVVVNNGLFNSEIWGNCAGQMNGQQLYLSIQVGSDAEMTPREPIYAVPYAWSLKPGAVISGSTGSDAIIHLETWSTNGRGLRAYAMSATGANYGVVGASRSPDGYGGYFYDEDDGVGVYGKGNSGVVGEGYGVGANGVLGFAGALGAGVKGEGNLLGYGGWFTGTDQAALYITSNDENTSDAVIVDGAMDNGIDFRVASNGTVKQALTSSGLVKAGVYAQCGTSIGVATRYFNNAGGAINVTGTAAGACTINFGFNVFDRYFVATSTASGARFVSCYTMIGNTSELYCHNWDATGTAQDGAIMVMVY